MSPFLGVLAKCEAGHLKMPVSGELRVMVLVVTVSTVIWMEDDILLDLMARCVRSTMGGRVWVGDYCIEKGERGQGITSY